jgi:hypothetical protein
MTKPTSPDKSAMPESRSAPPVAETVQQKHGPRLSSIVLALVIVVSLFCCGLMLLAPTTSLATNPVYKGF